MNTKAVLVVVMAAAVSGGTFAADVNGVPDGPGAVSAGEPAEPTAPAEVTIPRGTFAELDRNHDGKITRDEAATNPELNDSWTSLDTDQDGSLDQSEFSVLESVAPGAKETPADEPGRPEAGPRGPVGTGDSGG